MAQLTIKRRPMRKHTFLLSCMSFALVSKNRYRRFGTPCACHLLTLSLRQPSKRIRLLAGDGLLVISVMRWRRAISQRCLPYNSIFDYLKMESLTPYLKQLIAESALPLKSIETDFAID